MRYRVIETEDILKLQEQVNQLLFEGYKLVGGVTIGHSESDEYHYVKYLQALVKEK